MLLLLDDTSLPSIRRSILATCAAIILVAHYDLGIILPDVLFKAEDSPAIITSAVSLHGLLFACIYLLVRFCFNVYNQAISIINDLTTRNGVEAKAKDYLEQIDHLTNAIKSIDSKLPIQIPQLGDLEKILIQYKDIETILIPKISADYLAHKELNFGTMDNEERVAASILNNEQDKLCQEFYGKQGERRGLLSEITQKTKQTIAGLNQLIQVISSFEGIHDIKELRHYKIRLTAEMRSGYVTAVDKLFVANIPVVVALTFAATMSYPHFIECKNDSWRCLQEHTSATSTPSEIKPNVPGPLPLAAER